jgi:hypothetical protein
MHCGTCRASITAERQKGHVYYRCTKKIRACPEKYLREEALIAQLRALLDRVSMPTYWATKMLVTLKEEETTKAQSAIALGLPFQTEIAKLDDKLERLLDTKLEGLITSDEYTARKEKLIKQKLRASDNLTKSQTQGNRRLEPLKYFCEPVRKPKTSPVKATLWRSDHFSKTSARTSCCAAKPSPANLGRAGGCWPRGQRIQCGSPPRSRTFYCICGALKAYQHETVETPKKESLSCLMLSAVWWT